MSDIAFAGCPECFACGKGNPLYLDGGIVRCPVHGEVTDTSRMAEYRKAGTFFLLGLPPNPQKQPESNKEGNK